jgi:membrane protein YqaA with SNARE-associated domain
MTVYLLNYVEVILLAFLANVVPAFVPPTWMVLSLYHIDHPFLNTPIVVFLGVVGSVGGRFVMYYYSRLLGRYVPNKYAENLKSFRSLFEKRTFGLFIGSFIYSIGPLPSNILFIASGIARTEILPILGGFAFARGVSYLLLISASLRVFSFLEVLGVPYVKDIINVLGIVAGIAVALVDWKKFRRKNANRVQTGNYRSRSKEIS